MVEKKWLIARSKARPADLFIPAWNGGKGLAIDVTVTSLLQSSYSSSYKPGLAAANAADKKVLKYNTMSESSGFELFFVIAKGRKANQNKAFIFIFFRFCTII